MHRLPVLLSLLLPATAAAAEPVASVRVAFDRQGTTSVQVSGHADLAAGREVGADDPVRVASISKLVLALGVMRLVEAGTLDLDEDVSAALGWPLRHPQWPDMPITLRLLMSHQAGLTDAAGYWQVPLGTPLRALFDDPRAWDPAHAPGTYYRYANVGSTVVASVMEARTGERLDRLMERLVLAPLGISACYNWAACDDARIARAVVLYDDQRQPVRDDLHGRRPACPVVVAEGEPCDLARWKPGENGSLFSPQGGLRISANDLARIGRLLLGEGTLDGVRLLSPGSIREMTTPVWTYAAGNGLRYEEDSQTGDTPARPISCRYGLSVAVLATPGGDCADDPFGDGVERVGHSGSAYGLLSGLWVDRRKGTGVAYFATGVGDAAPGRHSGFTAVEETLAHGE